MQTAISKKLLILVLIVTMSISLGCLSESKPYADIEYRVSIWTDGNATLYLPLPLDLPNSTVSDLISTIRVNEKSANTHVSYDIIETKYGNALCVNTTGNVVLSAKADFDYLKEHSEVPVHPFIPGQDEPMYFDLSLHANRKDKLNYDRMIYLDISNNPEADVKVFISFDVTSDPGSETWLSLKEKSPYYGNLSLKPDWQIMTFRHTIGYH